MNITSKKIFELAERVAAVKYKWKRSPKATGKWRSFGIPDEFRPWYMEEDGQTIGIVSNESSDRHGSDDTKQWSIWFMAHQRSNIKMKKRFEFDQIDEAKKFAEKAYNDLINSTEDNLKDIREAMLKIRETRGLK